MASRFVRCFRALLLCAAAGLASASAGCQMTQSILHELQPHRLARWNQSSGVQRHGMFSVPVAEEVQAEQNQTESSAD